MYSKQNVNVRWNRDAYQADFRKHSAQNFVCVRFRRTVWEYDANWADEEDRASNQSWHPFLPKRSDILVASVDFGSDRAIALNGTKNLIFKGVRIGYSSGDVHFFPNQDMDGRQDVGEFRLNGTYINAYPWDPDPPDPPIMPDTAPELINSVFTKLYITGGLVRCTDNNTGAGFIMFSLEEINKRWNLDKTENDFRQHTARNFVCVKYGGDNWFYDSNWEDEPDRASNRSWHSFIPAATDILVAEVNFDQDKVVDLKGTNLTSNGIALGYSDGDLNFFANQGMAGAVDAGEFRLTGSHFIAYNKHIISTTTTTTTTTGKTTTTTTTIADKPRTVLVRITTGGFRCSDKNLGSGFIMYSKQYVNDRWKAPNRKNVFSKYHNAKNFVCVRYKNRAWQYDTNWEDEIKVDPSVKGSSSWKNFTPVATDAVVATVDYTTDKVKMLKGANMKYQGMQLGFQGGDLEVAAATKDLSYNGYGHDDFSGEFRAEGHKMAAWYPR
eukprot:TRINITY_DN108880_c0_g1_i1.p1 TRINITY_DN108880_c0_g1~~TRINITY_DN108880_c0_g1_i1.p1  ORF type:complete len:574 (-),score=95.43 TRINITY_DN108880_c0_g1_i1:96-1583(-)